MDAAYKVEAIDKTSNMTADIDKLLAQGTISKKNNEVIFAIKAEGGTPVDEYKGEDNEKQEEVVVVEEKTDKNGLDKTPKTGDEFNLIYLLGLMAASLVLGTGTVIAIRKRSGK